MINEEDDESDWKIGIHILIFIGFIALIVLINLWITK